MFTFTRFISEEILATYKDICLCDTFVVVRCCGKLCAPLQVSKLWFESFL